MTEVTNMKKSGIENIKSIVGSVGLAASAISDLTEIKVHELRAEVSDLDFDEKAELSELFKQTFNLKQDNVEENIEKGFDILLTAAVLLSKFL